MHGQLGRVEAANRDRFFDPAEDVVAGAARVVAQVMVQAELSHVPLLEQADDLLRPACGHPARRGRPTIIQKDLHLRTSRGLYARDEPKVPRSGGLICVPSPWTVALASMASHRADFGNLLATGVVSVGLGMAAASAVQAEKEARRANFRQELELSFESSGDALVDLTIGRTRGNAPFWNVTLKDGSGQLRTVRVELPAGADPYGNDSRMILLQNLSRAA